MRIAPVTLGTRGDAQPFAALALAPRAAGADPVVLTNGNNAGVLSRLALPAARFDADTDERYGSAEGCAASWPAARRGSISSAPRWRQGLPRGSQGRDPGGVGFLPDDIAAALATAQGARFTGSGFAPWPPIHRRPDIPVATGEWPVPARPLADAPPGRTP